MSGEVSDEMLTPEPKPSRLKNEIAAMNFSLLFTLKDAIVGEKPVEMQTCSPETTCRIPATRFVQDSPPNTLGGGCRLNPEPQILLLQP